MLLARASLRFLARHPAQCLLAVSGIALGTAIVIGILVTQASARLAFADSLRGVFGDASHRIVALDGEDFDEHVLVEVRRLAPALAPTPVVSGAVRLAPDVGRDQALVARHAMKDAVIGNQRVVEVDAENEIAHGDEITATCR